MKVGLSEGLDVGMSGGGDGMLEVLWRANGRIPSGRFWTTWLGAGCRTAGTTGGIKMMMHCGTTWRTFSKESKILDELRLVHEVLFVTGSRKHTDNFA